MISSTASFLINYLEREHIEERLNRLLFEFRANSGLPGDHQSSQLGHGEDTIMYRPYSKGDPVKEINWKIFARTEELYVRVREGLRRADTMFILDNSESMHVSYSASRDTPNKYQLSQLLLYLLGRIFLTNRDRVYLILKQAIPELLNPLNKYELLDTLINIEKKTAQTDGPSSIEDGLFSELELIYSQREKNKRSYLFIFSDMFFNPDSFFQRVLPFLEYGHEIFLFHIQEKIEKELSFAGMQKFINPETERQDIDADSDLVKEAYAKEISNHIQKIHKLSKDLGVHFYTAYTGDDPILLLNKYFL